MEIIKLLEPELREVEQPLSTARHTTKTPDYLPIPGALPHADFFEVLERRRTVRAFGRVSESSLACLLWVVAKTRLTFREPSGHLWQHRCTPSAGGRHPIDLVVIPPPGENARVYVYDPLAHALHEVGRKEVAVRAFHAQIQHLVATGEGTVFWFAAHYLRTLAKYRHPESLIWRDAGVLLGTICFTAEALGLNCCPCGFIGDAWISELFEDEQIGGAGGCIIGSH